MFRAAQQLVNGRGESGKVTRRIGERLAHGTVEDVAAMGGGGGQMVGHSKSLLRVLDQAARVAQRDTTVLIQGETGTGKELLARALHQNSPRKSQAFVEFAFILPIFLIMMCGVFDYSFMIMRMQVLAMAARTI